MAFNKISLNKVDAQSVSQIGIFPALPVNNVTNQFDIFYHLGTNLQQTTWTNPRNVDVSITLEGSVSSGTGDIITNRSQDEVIWSSATGAGIHFEFLNGYEVDLHSYIVAVPAAGGGAMVDWILEGSTDNTNWVKLDQVIGATQTPDDEDLYYCESRLGFFKYFRFRALTFAVGERVGEIMFFGKLRNLVTGQAAIENTKDIFASYPDVAAYNRYKNQIIRYDGTYWEPRIRFPFEIVKLNLSANHTITSAYKPTFYVVSPGGANRVITLPTSPNKDDVVKIKNVDGAYEIAVEEFVGDPSPVILSNAGKLQYEFVYDGTSNWIVTG